MTGHRQRLARENGVEPRRQVRVAALAQERILLRPRLAGAAADGVVRRRLVEPRLELRARVEIGAPGIWCPGDARRTRRCRSGAERPKAASRRFLYLDEGAGLPRTARRPPADRRVRIGREVLARKGPHARARAWHGSNGVSPVGSRRMAVLNGPWSRAELARTTLVRGEGLRQRAADRSERVDASRERAPSTSSSCSSTTLPSVDAGTAKVQTLARPDGGGGGSRRLDLAKSALEAASARSAGR